MLSLVHMRCLFEYSPRVNTTLMFRIMDIVVTQLTECHTVIVTLLYPLCACQMLLRTESYYPFEFVLIFCKFVTIKGLHIKSAKMN
jgi:hypothetical protein